LTLLLLLEETPYSMAGLVEETLVDNGRGLAEENLEKS
jgi:hypothetical protein